MARLTDDSLRTAGDIISRYPRPKSALIPLLHLAQEQDGWVSPEAMAHIAELVGVTPAEVLGTCSFYEMFKLEPVGRYMVNVCTNISCLLLGGEELLHHVEGTLGVTAGSTTPDGMFTVEDAECLAACTEAPCLQVNYRYFHQITHDQFDGLVDDLRSGRRDGDIPAHGTLARVRQSIPAAKVANITPPEQQVQPLWHAQGVAVLAGGGSTTASTPTSADGAPAASGGTTPTGSTPEGTATGAPDTSTTGDGAAGATSAGSTPGGTPSGHPAAGGPNAGGPASGGTTADGTPSADPSEGGSDSGGPASSGPASGGSDSGGPASDTNPGGAS